MAVAAGGLLWLNTQTTPLGPDLCERDNSPKGTTIILIDGSDPLAALHREKLAQVVRELKGEQDSHLAIHPGERVVVYGVIADVTDLKAEINICRPLKNIHERTWVDELTEGQIVALKRWHQFTKTLEGVFARLADNEQPQSPILETLSVVVPRHTPSTLPSDGVERHRTHLIIISDLLQHTDSISHYRRYPDIGALMNQDTRGVLPNLDRVEVSLFRLMRDKHHGLQGEKHARWWHDTVTMLGGTLMSFDDI